MRPIATISVLLALLMPLVQTVARSAGAAEPAEPWKIAFLSCQDLIREGDYKGALEACERAYSMNPDPGILVYIARIQTALVHPVKAHEALDRYLHSGSLDEGNRKTAEAQVRYLETLTATLSVTTRLEGAEIRVDDQVMDTKTVARGVQLMAGAHRVTLQANGSSFSRFIFLRAGERAQLELPGTGSIALRCTIPHVRFFIDDQEVDAAQAARAIPLPAGSHGVTFKARSSSWPTQEVMVSPDERVAVVCTPTPPVAMSAPPPAINQRGYWITGAGLALAGAAVATAIYNGSEYNRWQAANDSLRRDSMTPDLTLAEQTSRAHANDQLMGNIQTGRKIAIGLGISGGLLTAGGIALLFADSATLERNRSSAWLRKIVTRVTVNGAAPSGEIAWRGAW